MACGYACKRQLIVIQPPRSTDDSWSGLQTSQNSWQILNAVTWCMNHEAAIALAKIQTNTLKLQLVLDEQAITYGVLWA